MHMCVYKPNKIGVGMSHTCMGCYTKAIQSSLVVGDHGYAVHISILYRHRSLQDWGGYQGICSLQDSSRHSLL